MTIYCNDGSLHPLHEEQHLLACEGIRSSRHPGRSTVPQMATSCNRDEQDVVTPRCKLLCCNSRAKQATLPSCGLSFYVHMLCSGHEEHIKALPAHMEEAQTTLPPYATGHITKSNSLLVTYLSH